MGGGAAKTLPLRKINLNPFEGSGDDIDRSWIKYQLFSSKGVTQWRRDERNESKKF
jgi:hypothetical protein